MRFWGWLAVTLFAFAGLAIGSYFLLTEPVPLEMDCPPGVECDSSPPEQDLNGVGALLGGIGALLGGLMSVYKGLRKRGDE